MGTPEQREQEKIDQRNRMGEQSLGDLCLAATTMVLVLMDSGLYENNTGPLDSIVFESLTVLVAAGVV